MGLTMVIALLFSGCGSRYAYDVKPTPLKANKSTYEIKSIDFVLDHGHGRNLANKTFSNEKVTKKIFTSFLKKALVEEKISGNEYFLDIKMYYLRKYNYGGNALNKPEFKYSINILDKENKLIAHYGIPMSTTKYGYFKDLAVNTQIILFNRKAEHEPEDLELITKTMAIELSSIGD